MTNANEFRKRVKAKLIQVNSDIKEEDLYFSQTATLYILYYKPKYPEKTSIDFTVYQDIISGEIFLHGDEIFLPTIKREMRYFDSLTDFENQL